MRAAKPHELKTYAVPIMTARISEAELRNWFPVPFEQITDPSATPEPSMGALVKLDRAGYVVVYYGQISEQLTLRVPQTTKGPAFIEAFFNEVPLPKSRIVWCRPDAELPKRERIGKAARIVRSARTGKFVASAKSPLKAAVARAASRASAKRK